VRNPIHATGVGLLLYSKHALEAKAEASAAKLGFSNAYERMKAWFQKNF
jgi:cell division protein FtsA